nr:SDR family NAD(P)-dependent oxidoreductase [Streptomyces regalis]
MSSILITGASKGVGRATAAELAKRGHRVIATARDPRSLDGLEVAERLRLDVTDQASVDAAIKDAGEIDTLISNAGAIFAAAVEASPLDEIERLYSHNTVGAIRVTQAVLPQMRQRNKGRLIFVSSVGGRTVHPSQAASRPPSGRSRRSVRRWRSSSRASASTSPWPSRARSARARWTTCCPTVSRTTPTRRSSTAPGSRPR